MSGSKAKALRRDVRRALGPETTQLLKEIAAIHHAAVDAMNAMSVRLNARCEAIEQRLSALEPPSLFFDRNAFARVCAELPDPPLPTIVPKS